MTYLSKAQAALDTAAELINGPRQQSYGHPKVNFARISQRMEQILGVEIEPWKAAQILAELKMARLAKGWHEDSIHDAIAYLALMMELKDDA